MSAPDTVDPLAPLQSAAARIRDQLSQVIVGQDAVIEQLLTTVLAGGHCLLVGVPGLAKTLLVHSLAETLGLTFRRIQFTPDLMPADITGTEVIQEDRATGVRTLRFLPGPVFAHVVLADEINRTPPKTQAALLEAMQERQVTVGGAVHPLPSPFFVLATQNPIEQEGTYPLPEAQRDRFLQQIHVDYPAAGEELEIVRRTTSRRSVTIDRVLDPRSLAALQALVRDVPAADHVLQYALAFTRRSRPAEADAPTYVRDYVQWGAGPRGTQALVLIAKARALLHGRPAAGLDDIHAAVLPALRHRLITNFAADADRVSPDDILRRLAADIPRETTAAPFLDRLAGFVRAT